MALFELPYAGNIVSKRFAQIDFQSSFAPKKHTPPTAWPISSSAFIKVYHLGLVVKYFFELGFAVHASPTQTTNTTPSSTMNGNV